MFQNQSQLKNIFKQMNKNRQRSKNDKLLFKKFQESKNKQKEIKQLNSRKKNL